MWFSLCVFLFCTASCHCHCCFLFVVVVVVVAPACTWVPFACSWHPPATEFTIKKRLHIVFTSFTGNQYHIFRWHCVQYVLPTISFVSLSLSLSFSFSHFIRIQHRCGNFSTPKRFSLAFQFIWQYFVFAVLFSCTMTAVCWKLLFFSHRIPLPAQHRPTNVQPRSAILWFEQTQNCTFCMWHNVRNEMIFYDQKLSFFIAAIYFNDALANKTVSTPTTTTTMSTGETKKPTHTHTTHSSYKIWMTYEWNIWPQVKWKIYTRSEAFDVNNGFDWLQ